MSQLKNEKLEDAIIGTLIHLFEVRPILMPKLSVESFTKPDNRAIFDGIQSLYSNNREIDVLSIENWLKEHKGWEDHETANITSYEAIYNDPEDKVDELNDKKAKRNILGEIRSIAHDIENKPVSASDIVTRLEQAINDGVDEVKIPGLTMDQIKERDENQPKFEQVYTGDKFFDYTYYSDVGSRKGQYEVVLGRPKHGKTHYAIWRAKKYALQGHKVVYFTMESNDREIYDRFYTYFDGHNENVILVDKTDVSDLADIIKTMRYWKASWGAEVAVIDYLQRVPVKDINYHDETKRIVTCSNYLSDLAIRENILCIGLAQPSNPDRRSRRGYKMEPEVWDIYGSGAIEKDAFMVSSVFRPSEIEELCFFDHEGNIRGVQAPGSKDEADMLHKNTVFIRQKIVRNGEKYVPYVRFKHTDSGLTRVQKETNGLEIAENLYLQ